jgi:hypothetical protein
MRIGEVQRYWQKRNLFDHQEIIEVKESNFIE